MIHHARVQRMLARRRELTPDERAEVDRHLASCPECQATADAYAEQNVILRTMPEVPVPAALRMRVMAATRAPIGSSRPWRRFVPALSAASAAVLLAAVVLFAWGHRPQEGGNGAVVLSPTATAGTVHATPAVKAHPSSPHPAGHHRNTTHRHASHRKTGIRREGGSGVPPSTVQPAGGSGFVIAAAPPSNAGRAPVVVPQGTAVQIQPTTVTPQARSTALAGISRHPAAQLPRPTSTSSGSPQVAVGPIRTPNSPVPPNPPRTGGGGGHPVQSPVPAPTSPPRATAAPPATPTPGVPKVIYTAPYSPTPTPTPSGLASPPPPIVTPTP